MAFETLLMVTSVRLAEGVSMVDSRCEQPLGDKGHHYGLWLGPRIMDTSQSNRGTRRHHLRYPTNPP